MTQDIELAIGQVWIKEGYIRQILYIGKDIIVYKYKTNNNEIDSENTYPLRLFKRDLCAELLPSFEFPEEKKPVRYAKALYRKNGFYFASQNYFTSKEEARERDSRGFISWPHGTIYDENWNEVNE